MPHISGTFDVIMTPQPADSTVGDPSVGRLALDKQYHGVLSATSKGQMLSVMGTVENSAGYVAMERVIGTLEGRAGTFALQHMGIMTRGVGQLTISVVPDSGTEALTGIAGTMNIINTDGQHIYEFEYSLPE